MLGMCEFELVRDEADGWVVVYPFGLDGATQGRDYAEAAEMAADWLKTTLEYRMIYGEPLPKPTLGNEPQRGGRVLLVAVEVNLDSIDTVSAKDAAELLSVGKSRVSQMIKDGHLVGFKKGRDMHVTLDSIKARIAEKPKAGRPKRKTEDD